MLFQSECGMKELRIEAMDENLDIPALFLAFMDLCITNVFSSITDKMQRNTMCFFL
jgi:hypothetical protein